MTFTPEQSKRAFASENKFLSLDEQLILMITDVTEHGLFTKVLENNSISGM